MSQDSKLDKIVDMITEVRVILARHESLHERNTESIEYHIARTDVAEKSIEATQESLKQLNNTFIEELKTIKNHVTFVKGAMWAIGMVGAAMYAMHEMGILQKLIL